MLNQINPIYDIENYSPERKRRVAERIEELRRATFNPETEKAYTQEQFAEKLGYSLLTYKGWTGKAKKKKVTMPNINQLADLANAFKCDIGYLLCEDGYEKGGIVATDICKETGLTKQAVDCLRTPAYKEVVDFASYFIVNSQSIIESIIDEKKLHDAQKIWSDCKDFELVKECYEYAKRKVREKGLTVRAYFGFRDKETGTEKTFEEEVRDIAMDTYYWRKQSVDGVVIGYKEDGIENRANLETVLRYLILEDKRKERLFSIQEDFLELVNKYINESKETKEKEK